MTDDYRPPTIDWTTSPAEMAQVIHARGNPFDSPWLQRLMDALHRERRDMRVTDRASAEQSTAICKQYSFLEDMRSEIYHLEQIEQALARDRRKSEEQELRQIEERTLARKRAIEADEGDFNPYFKKQIAAAAAEAKQNSVPVALAVAKRALGFAVMYKILHDRLSARVAALEDSISGRGQT